MNKEELTITHHDIEITYNESKDRWLFTLRGKDRSADTLLSARKAIDTPPPKEEKPFRRFEAWHRSYNDTQKVTVTSMTEGGRFWITGLNSRGGKGHTQTSAYELYPCDPQNDAVIERLKAKSAEIDKLREEVDTIQKELRSLETKDWGMKKLQQIAAEINYRASLLGGKIIPCLQNRRNAA